MSTTAIVRGVYPEADDDFEEHQITEVRVGKDRIEVGFNVCTFCSVEFGTITPVVGMTLRLYPRGMGDEVRGVFIDGVCFRYRTPTQQDWKHRLWCAQKNADDQARAAREIPDRDRRWAALPPEFRARKQRFMANNPEWRRDYEGYELFTCEEAYKIALVFESADQIAAWSQLSWEAQKELHPEIGDGHSGNTFGMACRLAMAYLTKPGAVEKAHGALSPLVGSKAYGDTPKETTK